MAKKMSSSKNDKFSGKGVQLSLLKNVVQSIAGTDAVGIVDLLFGKKNVNEFLIAKKLNINVNQTRNILYKLSEKGLVSFIRKKDKKNGGWYTYYWTLNVNKSLSSLRDAILNEIKNLESNLENRRNKRYYYSAGADIEYSEENALENNFICPETGEVLELTDNSVIIDKITKDIESMKRDLAIVESQVNDMDKKGVAARVRVLKREEIAKKEKRATARKEREALKKKEGFVKKEKKTTSKKKPVKKKGKSK